MPYTFAKSQALFERAQRSIAGGVNSGIRKMETPVPLYFTHGRGARVWFNPSPHPDLALLATDPALGCGRADLLG